MYYLGILHGVVVAAVDRFSLQVLRLSAEAISKFCVVPYYHIIVKFS